MNEPPSDSNAWLEPGAAVSRMVNYWGIAAILPGHRVRGVVRRPFLSPLRARAVDGGLVDNGEHDWGSRKHQLVFSYLGSWQRKRKHPTKRSK